jgi:hypothetical protein
MGLVAFDGWRWRGDALFFFGPRVPLLAVVELGSGSCRGREWDDRVLDGVRAMWGSSSLSCRHGATAIVCSAGRGASASGVLRGDGFAAMLRVDRGVACCDAAGLGVDLGVVAEGGCRRAGVDTAELGTDSC